MLQCHGMAGFLIHAQTGWGNNFTFTCRNLSRAFDRSLTIRLFTAVPGIYPGFAKIKVNIPTIPQPCRHRGYKWLVHNACILFDCLEVEESQGSSWPCSREILCETTTTQTTHTYCKTLSIFLFACHYCNPSPCSRGVASSNTRVLPAELLTSDLYDVCH